MAMTRIFTTLALFAILMMVATLVLGLYLGDLHAYRDKPVPEEIPKLALAHRMFGVATALVVVLVNCIVVTYFIGTSRWCKEVAESYTLDPALVRRSVAIKRSAFPWAVAAMLAIVGVIALGAAADPGTTRPGTENWVIPHLLGALTGLAFIGWTFFIEYQRIAAHHEVITDILAEVKRIRTERGLEV
jgi:hypothetical protein